MKLTFKHKGREVSRSEFMRSIKENVQEAAKEAGKKKKNLIVEKMEAVRCPVHNESGTVEVLPGPTSNTFRYRLSGCCDALSKAAEEMLDQLSRHNSRK